MNRPSPDPKKGFGSVRLYSLLLIIAILPIAVIASAPSWWTTSNPPVISGTNVQDFAAVNQGQVKNIARAAAAELDLRLPGGAGVHLRNLVDGWKTPTSATSDYAVVNLGQLKAIAKPFYDRLIAVGYTDKYPWSEAENPANDYAMANIGQVKNLFSFDLTSVDPAHDTDLNGLPDWWEQFYFGHIGIDPNADPDNDGRSNLVEYRDGTDPVVSQGLPFPVVSQVDSKFSVLDGTNFDVLGSFPAPGTGQMVANPNGGFWFGYINGSKRLVLRNYQSVNEPGQTPDYGELIAPAVTSGTLERVHVMTRVDQKIFMAVRKVDSSNYLTSYDVARQTWGPMTPLRDENGGDDAGNSSPIATYWIFGMAHRRESGELWMQTGGAASSFFTEEKPGKPLGWRNRRATWETFGFGNGRQIIALDDSKLATLDYNGIGLIRVWDPDRLPSRNLGGRISTGEYSDFNGLLPLADGRFLATNGIKTMLMVIPPQGGPGTPKIYPQNTVTWSMAQVSAHFLPEDDQNWNGLPDSWEVQYFGELGVDPNADPDGDGRTNLQESNAGSDPTDFYNGVTPVVVAIPGTDGQVGPPGEFLADALGVEVRNGNGEVLVNAPVTFNVLTGNGGGLAMTTSDVDPLPVTLSLRTGADGRAFVYYRQPQQDGANSLIQVSAGTSGDVSFSAQAIEVDADHNGLPDAWERQYFSQTGTDPNADPDDDGRSNLEEYRNGTDPTVSQGALSQIVTVAGSEFHVFNNSLLKLGAFPCLGEGVITSDPHGGFWWGYIDGTQQLVLRNYHRLNAPGSNADYTDHVTPFASGAIQSLDAIERVDQKIYLIVRKTDGRPYFVLYDLILASWNPEMTPLLKEDGTNDPALSSSPVYGMAYRRASRELWVQYGGSTAAAYYLNARPTKPFGWRVREVSSSAGFGNGRQTIAISDTQLATIDHDSTGKIRMWDPDDLADVSKTFTFSSPVSSGEHTQFAGLARLADGRFLATNDLEHNLIVAIPPGGGTGVPHLYPVGVVTPTRVVQVSTLFMNGDQDWNGVRDSWEIEHFGQIGIDPAGDGDGDGLTNLQEFQNETDPTDYYNGANPTVTKTSGGDNQTTPANCFLPQALEVSLADANGAALRNAPLSFTVAEGGGKLSLTSDGESPLLETVSLTTDDLGKARVHYKQPLYGATTSTISVTAGDAAPVTFTANTAALVGRWRFEETDGNIATDSSGVGNDASLSGVIRGTGIESQKAILFDGGLSVQALQIDNTSNRIVPVTGKPFSISVWFRYNPIPDGTAFTLIRTGTASTSGFQLLVDNGQVHPSELGSPRLLVSSTQNGGTINFQSPASVTSDEWHHAVVVYNGTKATFYLNEVVVGSSTGTILSDTASILVGKATGESEEVRDFDGALDDLRIYHKALSEIEVQDLYRAYAPPNVAITAPGGNTGIAIDAELPVAAEAVSPSGQTVTLIEVFDGGTMLDEAAAASLSLTFSGTAEGIHVLTAKATDSRGIARTSAPVSVTIRPVPTVTLTYPQAAQTFSRNEMIRLQATASTANGSIAKVEFFTGTTKLGESFVAPFSFFWQGPEPGSHSLTAKATDDAGVTASSAPVAITVTDSSMVEITAPITGTVVVTGTPVDVTATASPMAGGSIALVEFFNGETKIGEDSTPPYTVQIASISQGVHSLTAKATDAQGVFTQSKTITLIAADPPSIRITSPGNGYVFLSGADVPVSSYATVSTGLQISRVEIFEGETKLGEATKSPFSVNLTGLTAGEHTLTAKVTDSGAGTATSDPVTIRINANPTISIATSPSGSIVPANEALTVTATVADSDGTIASVQFYDNNSFRTTVTTTPYEYTISSLAPGSHEFIAKVTDDKGGVSVSSPINLMADAPPTVVIDSPSDGDTIAAGGSLVIETTAQTDAGGITKIELFDGEAKLGEPIAGKFIWKDITLGEHVLTAKATNSNGGVGISTPVTVTAVAPPVVTLTSSAGSSPITPGSSLTLTASATSVSGSIARIDLFDGSLNIGGGSGVLSYSQTIGSITAGGHRYLAKVTDSNGIEAISAVLVINVSASGGVIGGPSHGGTGPNPPPEPGGQGRLPQTDPDPASSSSVGYMPTLSVSAQWSAPENKTNSSTIDIKLSSRFPNVSDVIIERKVSDGPWETLRTISYWLTNTWDTGLLAGKRYQYRAYGENGSYKTAYTNVVSYEVPGEIEFWHRSRGIWAWNPGYQEFVPGAPPKYYLKYSATGHSSSSEAWTNDHPIDGYSYHYWNSSGSSSYSMSDTIDPLVYFREGYEFAFSYEGSARFQSRANWKNYYDGERSSSYSGNAIRDETGAWVVDTNSNGHVNHYVYRPSYFGSPFGLIYPIDPDADWTYTVEPTEKRWIWHSSGEDLASISGAEVETLSEEYTSDRFVSDALESMSEYSDWSSVPPSPWWIPGHNIYGTWVGGVNLDHDGDYIDARQYKYKYKTKKPGVHHLDWYEIFVPKGNSPEIQVIKSRRPTLTGPGETEEFEIDLRKAALGPEDGDASIASGDYCLIQAPYVNVYDGVYYSQGGIKLDYDEKRNSAAIVKKGQTSQFSVNATGPSGTTYTLNWSGTGFVVIDTRTGQTLSSGHTFTQQEINSGTKGTTFRVVPTSGAKVDDTLQFRFDAIFDGQSVGQDQFAVTYQPDPDTVDDDKRDYTVPADYASGTRYRKIALNGRPIPDEKPQQSAETDEQKEETYVDAMTMGLRHSTTDVYVPVAGSPLVLSVRRNAASENWTMRSGLRPHERPNRPFGIGWGSNVTPHVEYVNAPDQPSYAYITDENGSVHRFIRSEYNKWQPMPTSNVEATDYLTSFDGYTFRQKFGNQITFSWTQIYLSISTDRQKGGPDEDRSYSRATSVIDRLGNSLVYTYANASTLTPMMISRSGHPDQTIYIAQNDEGLITKIWDPNGNLYRYSYDQISYNYGGATFKAWKLASVSAPDGGVTNYGYDFAVEDDLSPINSGDAPVPKFHCDLSSISDPLGKTYSFTYEFDHTKRTYTAKHGRYYTQTGLPRNVAKVTLPGSHGYATFRNNSSIAITYGSDANNTVPQLTFDSRCITSVTDAEGHTTDYRFSNGQVVSANIDAISAETTAPKIVYFTRMTIDHPIGGSEVYDFDPGAGMALKSAKDMNGNTTTFSYDDVWVVSGSPTPLFPVSGFNARYDDPTRQTNAQGESKVFTYGTQWRIMSSVLDEEGRKTEYTLDNKGRRTVGTIKNSSGATVQQTTFTYGSSAHPGVVTQRTVNRLSGDPAWAGNLVTSYGLDGSGRIASETVDPSGLNLVTHHGYDHNGNKLSTTDPNGNTTYFEYDRRNRLAWVTYADASEKHLEYDVRGNKTFETDENGHVTEFGYDDLSRLSSIKKTSGSGQNIVTRYGYNKVNSKTSVTDPNGNQTTMDYDAIQRLKSTTNPAGTTTYVYGVNSGGSVFDSSGFKPTRSTDPRGYVTNFLYDGLYRLASRSVQYGNGQYATSTFGYDRVGNQIRETDPLQKTTNIAFDALNRPTQVTYADGQRVQSSYTSTGLKWKIVDELNRVTETEYDRAGRPVKVLAPTLPGNQRPVTQTTYDDAGNVIAVINPLGNEWNYGFDERNRKRTETGPSVTDAVTGNAARPVTTWDYDNVGNLVAVTDPNGNRSNTVYDHANRPISVQAPAVIDPTDGQSKRPTTTTTYDANGNVLSVTDPNGHVTQNTYDGLNWLRTTTDGANNTVSYEYDKVGNRTKVIDGNAHSTSFDYDGLNRNTKSTDAAGRSTLFQYNSVNKTSRTDANGQLTTYSYDNRHRLKTVNYSVSSAGNRTYSYDAAGNLLSVIEPGKSGKANVTYTYDALNRVVTETSGGAAHQYEYDLAGNRLQVTYGGSGRIIVSTYDALNRLKTMTEGGRTTTYRYDLSGRVRKKELPADTMSEFTYDALGRVQTILAKAGGNDLSLTLNKYDLAGNVTTVEEQYLTGTLPSRTVHNTYDNANRLYREAVDLGSDESVDITTTYVYDGGNNREKKTVVGGTNAGVTDYTVNNLNQVTEVSGPEGSIAYTYDANGNRKTRTKGSLADTYAYDAENRLVELTKNVPDAGLSTGTFRYLYDYRTRRVERDESQAGGNTTKVVFSGGLSCFEQEGSSRTVEYIRGSDYGGGVGGILYTLRNNTPSYSHYNNRGDVVAKTNGDGALTYQAQYEAFGSRTQEEGSTPDRQRMNTKDEDPTGLVNHGFRYFDLETDTWLTPDPAGFVDGPNLYAYVRQNPWTKFDPEGLEAVTAEAFLMNPFVPPQIKAGVVLGGATAGGVGMVGYGAYKQMVVRANEAKQAQAMWEHQRTVSNHNADYGPIGGGKTGTPQQGTTLVTTPTAESGQVSGFGSTTPQQAMTLPGKEAVPNAPLVLTTPGGQTAQGLVMEARSQNLQPVPTAQGSHTTFKIDPVTGKITHYETWKPQTNPQNPQPWESTRRFDGTGGAHYNKETQQDVPTPHIHEKSTPGGVRPAEPQEEPTP